VASNFVCGSHQAIIANRGGQTYFGDIPILSSVRWGRVRDDISTAQINVPSSSCCDLLGDLRCVLHELHLVRDGVVVWQGPITRIEYDFDEVRIFAEDILWQAKRRVLEEGYNQTWPNQWNAVARMHWLMQKCDERDGNPWHAGLHPIYHANDPNTLRTVAAYQFTIWEDFDKYAEDGGTDYTVVNRDIYYFDHHLAWKVIAPLDENFLSQFPRVVEYGNELATRVFVTNSQGHAGIAYDAGAAASFGLVDLLISNQQDETDDPAAPSAIEIGEWKKTAESNLSGRAPAPVGLNVPANSTLLPGAAWTMDDLIPGAWFLTDVSHLCRNHAGWQRIHDVTVTEGAPEGENVAFTAADAPTRMDLP